MANYRKSFNFRSGVQVDNDRLIVDGRGNVGIGTSIPNRELDVFGTTRLNGLLESNNVSVSGISTFSNDIKVGSGITFGALSGIITAVSFRGDGSQLSGVVGIATGGWVSNAGTLSTSQLIGIGTTNPVYQLQIGQNPVTSGGVAITSEGNVLVNGISTFSSLGITGLTTTQNLQVTGVSTIATLGVTGLNTTRDHIVTGVSTIATLGVTGLTTTQNLQVTGVSTLGIVTSHNIFSAGVVTATSFVGPLTGTASTALGLSGTPNIIVGILTATTSNATTLFVSGNTLSALSNGNVGIGTTNPTEDLQVKRSGAAAIEIISDTSTSTIAIGKSVGLGNSSAAFIYDSGLLKINNYDLGGIEFNLHEGTGTGTTDGFRVKYDSSTLMNLTYDGKLGINASNPDYNLQVNGTSYISGNSQIVGILTIGTGGSKIVLDPIGGNSVIPFPASQNLNTTSGLSTFNNLKTTGYVEVGLGVTVKQDSIFEKRVAINTSTFSVLDPSSSYKLIVSGGTRSAGDISLSGRLGISSDGTFYSDPRVIPNVAPFSSDVPFFSYGDVQMVTQGGASIVTQNIILVPQVGVATVGFGTTNGGLKPGGSFDTNNYLTTIGINTYFARGILDVGTASTTMNSYFIPPSLTQSELDIVSTLWNSPTRTGYGTARRVTPNGVPPGALVYNKTVGQLQIGIGSTSFVGLATIGSSGGKVIQVATGSTDIPVYHAGDSSTGLSASITLSSPTSKVMVYVTQPLYLIGSGSLILYRSGSGISTSGISTTGYGAWNNTGPVSYDNNATASISYLDSPGTVSTLTYETFVSIDYLSSCTSNAYSTPSFGGSYGSAKSTITLMEILA